MVLKNISNSKIFAKFKAKSFHVLAWLIGFSFLAISMFMASSYMFFTTAKNMQCEKLLDIVDSSTRIEYLRTWVERAVHDKKILILFGEGGTLSGRGDMEKFGQLKVDWSSLGINPRYASVSFNPNKNFNGGELTYSDLQSVRFIDGREAAIVFVIGGRSDLKLSPREENNRVPTIYDDVYINCTN